MKNNKKYVLHISGLEENCKYSYPTIVGLPYSKFKKKNKEAIALGLITEINQKYNKHLYKMLKKISKAQPKIDVKAVFIKTDLLDKTIDLLFKGSLYSFKIHTATSDFDYKFGDVFSGNKQFPPMFHIDSFTGPGSAYSSKRLTMREQQFWNHFSTPGIKLPSDALYTEQTSVSHFDASKEGSQPERVCQMEAGTDFNGDTIVFNDTRKLSTAELASHTYNTMHDAIEKFKDAKEENMWFAYGVGRATIDGETTYKYRARNYNKPAKSYDEALAFINESIIMLSKPLVFIINTNEAEQIGVTLYPNGNLSNPSPFIIVDNINDVEKLFTNPLIGITVICKKNIWDKLNKEEEKELAKNYKVLIKSITGYDVLNQMLVRDTTPEFLSDVISFIRNFAREHFRAGAKQNIFMHLIEKAQTDFYKVTSDGILSGELDGGFEMYKDIKELESTYSDRPNNEYVDFYIIEDKDMGFFNIKKTENTTIFDKPTDEKTNLEKTLVKNCIDIINSHTTSVHDKTAMIIHEVQLFMEETGFAHNGVEVNSSITKETYIDNDDRTTTCLKNIIDILNMNKKELGSISSMMIEKDRIAKIRNELEKLNNDKPKDLPKFDIFKAVNDYACSSKCNNPGPILTKFMDDLAKEKTIVSESKEEVDDIVSEYLDNAEYDIVINNITNNISMHYRHVKSMLEESNFHDAIDKTKIELEKPKLICNGIHLADIESIKIEKYGVLLIMPTAETGTLGEDSRKVLYELYDNIDLALETINQTPHSTSKYSLLKYNSIASNQFSVIIPEKLKSSFNNVFNGKLIKILIDIDSWFYIQKLTVTGFALECKNIEHLQQHNENVTNKDLHYVIRVLDNEVEKKYTFEPKSLCDKILDDLEKETEEIKTVDTEEQIPEDNDEYLKVINFINSNVSKENLQSNIMFYRYDIIVPQDFKERIASLLDIPDYGSKFKIMPHPHQFLSGILHVSGSNSEIAIYQLGELTFEELLELFTILAEISTIQQVDLDSQSVNMRDQQVKSDNIKIEACSTMIPVEEIKTSYTMAVIKDGQYLFVDDSTFKIGEDRSAAFNSMLRAEGHKEEVFYTLYSFEDKVRCNYYIDAANAKDKIISAVYVSSSYSDYNKNIALREHQKADIEDIKTEKENNIKLAEDEMVFIITPRENDIFDIVYKSKK